jgi:hypothetical protein
MTVGDLANECGLSKYAAIQIARSRIPGFARIHKGEAYGLTKNDVVKLRPLFIAARPAPRPIPKLAEIPMSETKTEEVPTMEHTEGFDLGLVSQKTGIPEGSIKSLLSRNPELQKPPYSIKAMGARIFFLPFVEWLATHKGSALRVAHATQPATFIKLPSGAQLHELRLMAEKGKISREDLRSLLGLPVAVSTGRPRIEAKASLEEGEKAFQKIGELFHEEAQV